MCGCNKNKSITGTNGQKLVVRKSKEAIVTVNNSAPSTLSQKYPPKKVTYR